MKALVHLVAALVAQGKTADPTGAVQLVQGNVECTSCHNPHVQSKDLDLAEFPGSRRLAWPTVPGLPRCHAGRPPAR